MMTEEKMDLDEFFDFDELSIKMMKNKMKVVGYPSKNFVAKVRL